jgi:hypothetical protein
MLFISNILPPPVAINEQGKYQHIQTLCSSRTWFHSAKFFVLLLLTSSSFAVAQSGTTSATTSQLLSSGSPSTTGAPLTFLTTVSNGGQNVVTGSVQFLDGTTVLGSQTLLSNPEALSLPSTNMHAYGDSIIGCMGLGSAPYSDCFVSLAETTLGMNSLTGYAPSGDMACDTVLHVFSMESPTGTSVDPIYLLDPGGPDARVNSKGNFGVGPYEAVSGLCRRAAYAQLAIGSAQKISGFGGTQTGSWLGGTTYKGTTDAYSTTAGSTRTYSLTTTGGPILIWYDIIGGNTGTGTVQVDNNTPIPFNAYNTAWVNTGNGATASIGLLTIPGISSGTHSILVTVTSPSGSNNVVGIVQVGTTPNTQFTTGPVVLAMDVIPTNGNAWAAGTLQYSQDIGNDVAELRSYGLDVRFLDMRPALQNGLSSLYTDQYHPNVAGNAAMAPLLVQAVNSNAVATFTTSSLSAGTHAITAVYSGGTNNYGSTSAVLNQVVQSVPSVTLSASANTISPGQAVQLVATVPGVGGVTPTGTVTFIANSTGAMQGPLATASLVNGVATYYGLVWGGTDTITANYSGDTNYPTSISNSVTVINASVTGKLIFNWPYINFSQPVAYGASSGSWPVTLQNLTGVTVATPSLNLTGTGAANFQITSNTCTSSLVQGAVCSFNVVLAPTTGGATNGAQTAASLTASTSTSTSYTTTIALSGVVVARTSALVFNWPFLSFTPAVAVGSVSGNWPVTLTNQSTTAVTLASPAISFTDASFALAGSQANTWTGYRQRDYGDSILAGSGATSCTTGGTCFAQLNSAALGTTLGNDATPGDQACDTINDGSRIMQWENPVGDGSDPLYFLMVGVTDVFAKGAGSYEAVYQLCHQAALAWLGTRRAQRIAGYLGATTGSWTNDYSFSASTGIQSTTNGSSVSYTLQTFGRAIYVWYRIIDGNGGTFNVSLDGGAPLSMTAFTNPPVATQNQTYAGKTGMGIALLRIPSAGAGTHTLLITVTSATSTNNLVSIVAVGTASMNHMVGGPTVLAAGVLPHRNNVNPVDTAAYNSDAHSDVLTLQADGLDLRWVDLAPVMQNGLASLYYGLNGDTGSVNDAGQALLAPVITAAALHSDTTDSCSGQTLAPGASCNFTVNFSPLAADITQSGTNVISGSMTATANSGTLSASLPVSGWASAGGYSINWNQDQQAGVSTIDFGPHNTHGVTSGPWPITVYNSTLSTQTLTLTPSLGVFTVISNTCTNVPSYGSCTFGLDFTPQSVTTYQGKLTISGGGYSYIFNTWGQAIQ